MSAVRDFFRGFVSVDFKIIGEMTAVCLIAFGLMAAGLAIGIGTIKALA